LYPYPAPVAIKHRSGAKIKIPQGISPDATTQDDPTTHQPTDIPFTAPQLNQHDWKGQQPPDEKQPNTFRLMFHNINGIGTKGYISNMATLANEQCSLDVDVQGITEHCINIHHHDTHSRLQSGLRQNIPDQKIVLQINAGNMSTDNVYLPGGTAMIVTGNAVGRIEPNGTQGDPMGRWSFIHLRRKNQKPVTIYTVYQVCLQPTNVIGHTAWHQQRLALNMQNRTNSHPRQAFIEDLTHSVRTFQAMNHDIIIGGDFNETTDKHNSGMLKLLTSTNLIDPFLHMNPNLPTFNTYKRGSTRIDAILCSPNILPSIRSLGYAPFNWVTNSDHRAILLDICSTGLFHESNESMHSLSSAQRAIRSNDKQRTPLFIDKFYQHLESNNCETQLAHLTTPEATHLDAEKLDQLIGQAGDSAEKSCKKRRPEFYSHALNSHRIKTSIALGHLNNIRNHKSLDTTGFQARLSRAGIEMELPYDQKAAFDLYVSLKKSLIEDAKNSADLREQELQSAINSKYSPGSSGHTKRLKAIKKGEATRKAWKTLKFLKSQSGATQTLNRIDIPQSWPTRDEPIPPFIDLEDPKKCTVWNHITNPDDIDHYVRLRNRGHFGQAQGTPFTEVPLAHQVNWTADTPTCEEILAGHHHNETISAIPQCEALLKACKVATELDLLPYEITEAEFAGKIRSWKELTTTSPSGRHLGRYKALFVHIPQSTEDIPTHDISYKAKQQFIIRALVSIINFCLKTGHVLECWKTIINTMIFKETGNYQIHRLRVIHIYEADFNLVLAVKWRQLLQSSDHHGIINDGLFGGRPGCEAQSLTFLEELKYDISYMTRRTLFNFDNDATSCYDRIIVSLASLINRKYGIHRKVVAIHASTLQQARFHLRTLSGISEQFYTHSIEFPVYGSGQGSGNSPGIWLFISSTLCDIHNKHSHGATFTNPDGTESVTISMVGFVDDSTGSYNDFRPQHELPFDTMMDNMQQDAQTWNDLLWCSGGKLELPKCSYHVLRFKFAPNGKPTPDLTIPDKILQIRDAENGHLIPIPAKQADNPHKTLGHWKSPVSNNNPTQLKALATKAKQTTMLIATGAFSRHGAELAYNGVYLSSLKYVLPQCFFSHNVLAKTEAQTASTLLSKMGFNRHTSCALRYTPKWYAGCGMVPWWVLQSEGQLCLFIKHWRTNTMISKTLRITTAWSQWQSGLSEPLLSNTETPLPHLEARWLSSLRYGLNKTGTKIQLNQTFVTPPERDGDIYLMEWAIASGSYTDHQLRIINYCRTYIQVTTISELFQPSCNEILQDMYNCTRPPWFNTTQFITIQHRPSPQQIRKLWMPLCQLWQARLATGAHTFGPFNGRATSSRPNRQTYQTTSNTGTIVHHWINGSYWRLCSSTNNNTQESNNRHFITDAQTEWLPTTGSIPINVITIQSTQNGTIFSTTTPEQMTNQLPTNHSAETTANNTTLEAHHDTITGGAPQFRSQYRCPIFQAYISPLDEWESRLLKHVRFTQHPRYVQDQLRACITKNNHLIMVTDQSFQDQNASYGWLLCTSTGQTLAENHGPSMGPPSRPRADAWGILSASLFLKYLPRFLQDIGDQPPVWILNRNPGIIRRLQQRGTFPQLFCNATLTPNWDILEQTHATTRDIKFRIEWETMMAYRDRHNQSINRPFSFDQTLADTREKTRSFLKKYKDFHLISPFLPESKCMVHTGTSTTHSRYISTFREAATLPALHTYLQKKHQWTRDTIDDIQWNWFRQAVRSYKHSSANHLTKLVYNQLATPDRKTKAGGQTWHDPICTHCNLQPETFDHLLKCNEPDAITFRMKLIPTVTGICSRYGAPAIFQKTLIGTLEDWMSDRTIHNAESDPYLTVLFTSQDSIGMNNLMRGFLSNEWSHYLAYTITDQPLRCTHQTFFAALITSLWTAQTDFWTAYQLRRHTPPDQDEPDPGKIAELKEEIRFLFALKPQVLPNHTATYFPIDLESFLKYSTKAQLQNYITNYGQAIKSSIHQAQKQSIANTPRLFTFPGFQRLTATATTTIPLTNLVQPPPIGAQPMQPEGHQATATDPESQSQTNQTPIPDETIPAILPPAMPPEPTHPLNTVEHATPAPNETTLPERRPQSRLVQQSLSLMLRRRRSIRDITPPPSETDTTVASHMDQSQTTSVSNSTDPEPTNQIPHDRATNIAHPPATAARANFSYKHSKWRPSAAVRDYFSQYFQPRR